MLRLYDSLLSGNSWKVRILLSQLHLKYERVTLDLARGDTHRPDFRRISRFSRIPALMIEDGRTIVESGAILTYLAEGTDLLPADGYLRAEVLSYSRSRGLFAGISLEGSTLRPDSDATADVYGRKLTAKEIILGGKTSVPASGRHLVSVLQKNAPRNESAKN